MQLQQRLLRPDTGYLGYSCTYWTAVTAVRCSTHTPAAAAAVVQAVLPGRTR
jgi:hypothetical protein